MLNKSLLALSLVITSQATLADWYVQPKLGADFRSYTLNIGENNQEATANIPGLNVGISFINAGGYYFDVEYSTGEGDVSDFFLEDDYIEHSEFTLSTGYSLGSGYTVFGGFTTSGTLIENRKEQNDPITDMEFNITGFFGGMAKTFVLAKSHSINISGALGLMAAEFNSPAGEEHNTYLFNADGDGTGFSGSASYSYRSAPMALTLGMKVQSYSYSDMVDADTGAQYADISEDITTAFAKASFLF